MLQRRQGGSVSNETKWRCWQRLVGLKTRHRLGKKLQQVADEEGTKKAAAVAKKEDKEKDKKRTEVLSRIAARKNKSAAPCGAVLTVAAAAVPKTPPTPSVPALDPAPASSPANGVSHRVAIREDVKGIAADSENGYYITCRVW
jgi:hypothetical protein